MKDFLPESNRENRFFPLFLYIRQKTAKRDRKIVYFTKSSQIMTIKKLLIKVYTVEKQKM